VSVSVKDSRFGSFLSNLLFLGIDSEVQREGVCVEGTGTKLLDIMRCETCDWDVDV
jgi:hypothetical protein